MNTCGVIDIGANTIRLNIYRIADGRLEDIFSKKSVAGLRSYVENGELSKRGIKKLEMVLGNLLKIYELLKTERLYAFATASLRNISNQKDVIDYIKKKLDIEIEVIGQEMEATFGFQGISNELRKDKGITVDIGGGSVEIVRFEDGKPKGFLNLDEGSLSLYSKFSSEILPTEEEIKKMRDLIERKLVEAYDGDVKSKKLIGIGGTIRAAGNIIYELGLSDNTKRFTYENVKYLLRGIRKRDKEVIKVILQVVPERIHTISGGVATLRTVMEHFSSEEVLVSSFGIREGFLLDKLRREKGGKD
ncbi:MAG: phosphatase [Tissierellia bacterium]|nr:phosphatase [Tissierellia bacterium]